jgi:WD40 repeat protein
MHTQAHTDKRTCTHKHALTNAHAHIDKRTCTHSAPVEQILRNFDARTDGNHFTPPPAQNNPQPLTVGNEVDGHTKQVTSVAFSADGKWLVSGSEDKTVR